MLFEKSGFIMKGKTAILLLLLIAGNFVLGQDQSVIDSIFAKKNWTHSDYLAVQPYDMDDDRLNKVTGEITERKFVVISGNKITTVLYNYGSVCAPGGYEGVIGNVTDLVWNGLGYGYEFGLLAGARVPTVDGDSVSIISDSHRRIREGDYSEGGAMKWGWLPKSGYADPNQNEVASLTAKDKDGDGKPDSWPDSWYSPGAGTYLWPAFLGDASTAPDEEVFYAIDDYTNLEFIEEYQPFGITSPKGGLGLDADVRILQFNNPLAEDLIFMVYQMTNASNNDLGNLYMGMYGDPHIGGPSDWNDDMAFFIPPKGEIAEAFSSDQRDRSMVFGWDKNSQGDGGATPGYFGWKFLESPSIATDDLDNDDDGIKNESPFNDKGYEIDGINIPLTEGIDDTVKYTNTFGKPKARWSGDEDGDWNVEKNDVGIDGIGPESVNYPGKDYGEGDGVPSQAWYDDLNNNGLFDKEEEGTLTDTWSKGKKWAGSEPNFGFRDISESDQLGLTGFTVALANDALSTPKNDDRIWEWLTEPEIDPEQPLLKEEGGADNVFNFSTGPMKLEKGESQRFSMVILMGEDQEDLLLNSQTSVRILEADYQFAQPPDAPKLTAVAGDGKVTLYWDTRSERSKDPLTSEFDFEGYKIYRSQDYTFSDVFTITDANGNPFLGKPLLDTYTAKRAQFDIDNEYSGLSDVEYVGRGIKYDLGSNTGLVHEYVDSTVQNGITYYYAIVAYDRGADNLPPSENQPVITPDPITGELIFEINTVEVTPGAIGSGIIDPEVGNEGSPTLTSGNPTGNVKVKVLDKLSVPNKIYKVTFNKETSNSKTLTYYNVLDSTGIETTFTSKGTIFVSLPHKNIVEESVEVFDKDGSKVSRESYYFNPIKGQIASIDAASLPEGEVYTAKYRYYPVYKSRNMDKEDANDAFDGMRVFVQEDELNIDFEKTGFLGDDKIDVIATPRFPALIGDPALQTKIRADYEIRWKSLETDADGKWIYGDTTNTFLGSVVTPFEAWYIIDKEPSIHIEERATMVVIEDPSTDTYGNGQWDWGESIIFQPQGATNAATSYQLDFIIDTSASSIELPKANSVYRLHTKKPFEKGDEFVFETKMVEFDKKTAKASVNDIYVVPNPYVGYSPSETPGRTQAKRGEREIQFRNLPPECTIRIYTITGELVDKIVKSDDSSIATWNLLSSEGMRISYGIYIYHVDIPGVGEKIGRFGVIK